MPPRHYSRPNGPTQLAHVSEHVMPFALQSKALCSPFPVDSSMAKTANVMASALDPSHAVRFHALNATEDTWPVPFVHAAGSSGSTMVDFDSLLTPCSITEHGLDATMNAQHPVDSDRFVMISDIVAPARHLDNAPNAQSDSNSFTYSHSNSASNSYTLSNSIGHSQSDSQSQLHSDACEQIPLPPGGPPRKTGLPDISTDQDSPGRKCDIDIPKSRAEIRRARAARNRSSARRSRLRKKAESERDKENAQLVEQRNTFLKEQVKELHEKMVALQRVADALGLPQQSLSSPFCAEL